MFCQIGDPKKLEAVLVIDQRDIEYGPHGAVRSTSSSTSLPHDTLHSRNHGDCPDGVEGRFAADVGQNAGRGTGDDDRSDHGRLASAEHVVSGPRAAGRSGQPFAVGFRGRGKMHVA